MITGSGNAANAQDMRLALYLANRAADYEEAVGPKASAIAQAALTCACKTLSLAGYDARGNEHAIYGDVLDWGRAHDRPAPTTSDRKRWAAQAEAELASVLADHRRAS